MSWSGYVVACVGKPSVGKSSFFNAATDANAKVGNYPFTTIEPNVGVTCFPTKCGCSKVGKSAQCAPRHGRCINGTRYVPIKLLDVAGLVPGACNGEGLGNKFLDDLRQADVFMHIIDVSGTVDAKGQATVGYDPINDIEWLRKEIHIWIFNNLWTKWSSITRRHVATRASAAETLTSMFSGYGANQAMVQTVLDRVGVKEPAALEAWDEDQVNVVVAGFLEERFPTILVLNKADQPDSDKNIARICKKYGEDKIVVCSALAECFLRKMAKSGFISYESGEEEFYTAKDLAKKKLPAAAAAAGGGAALPTLKPVDEKMERRLENIRDMVLCRFGTTGVMQALDKAVSQRKPVVAFPVTSIHNCVGPSGDVFSDCMLLKPGTTVREFADMLGPEVQRRFAYAEGIDGRRLGEEEPVTEENNIIRVALTHQNDNKN